MLIPIQITKTTKKRLEIGESDIEKSSFRGIGLKEVNLEDFIRKNIAQIFEEETLLIVGQQVANKKRGRSDLIALDENGYIVIIEIKRDEEDVKVRKEPFETQAIRYAASIAKIKTPDELVDKIFSYYVEKHQQEFDMRELKPRELASRAIDEFLDKNSIALTTFNMRQRIILIASSFDDQTLSAVAWLSSNKIEVSCFTLLPIKIDKKAYLQIDKIIPPPKSEDFYIEVANRKFSNSISQVKSKSPNLPSVVAMFEKGILKRDDRLVIKGYDNSGATVHDGQNVKFKGKILSYREWGIKVTKWSSICIYKHAIHKKTSNLLQELRLRVAK